MPARGYKRGERWWLDTPELNEQAAEEQADRYEGDPWDDPIQAYNATQQSVSVAEVLKKIGKFTEHWNRLDQMRVARCLKAAGWDRHRLTGAGVGTREWRYWPKTPPTSQP
jgi:predicted P-loop ATPase